MNLIYAFHASLSSITKGSKTLEERFELHRQVSKRVKDSELSDGARFQRRGADLVVAGSQLGLKQVALDSQCAANGMTAVRAPFRIIAE